MATKAVLYARYSPRPEDADAIAKQVGDMESWCSERGIKVMGVCFDPAVSGTVQLWDRPGLRQGMELLNPGWVLVVRNLNRIARKVSVALAIEEMVFDERKAELASVEDGGYLSNDRHARFTRTVLYAVSDLQREEGNERTSRRMRHKIWHEKRKLSSQPPWGFRFFEDSIIPDDYEQEILGIIANLRQQDYSYASISSMLNQSGYDNPRALKKSKEWNEKTVSRVCNTLQKMGRL